MPLSTGTRLGGYEIVASIGSGGMGEVYRARDTKLDRDVALKVLPPHLATDSASRARFEREAKTVAALSHPNILSIFDFAIHGGTPYAVMELLEGETLRERMSDAALPVRKAIDVAVQIAQGLAAAHEKGVVHRDLKPENVVVTPEGRVKILDFGLARQVDRDRGGANSPTELGRTDPGTIMGTIGYMSPEQVRGQPADHRSDVFSLGCVLFEMATGRRAFQRDTPAETMTAILREDPADGAPASAGLPAALDRVVRHCLEKRPEERFQSAHDLAFALRALADQTTSGGAAAPITPARTARRVLQVGAAAAVVVVAFLGGRWSTRGSPGALSAQPAGFQQITDAAGVETSPTISPDGKTVVYVSDALGNADLYLVRVGGRNPVVLTPDSKDNDWQPAFSPDGEHIAFRSERGGGGIFVMNATGESVRRLTDYGYHPTWAPAGREIIVSNGTFVYPTDRGGIAPGLWAVDVATATRRAVLTIDDAVQPTWSPHGHRVAYWGLRSGTGQRDLWTVAADGSEAVRGGTPVTDDLALDWSPAWSPDGRFLFFASTRGGTMNLWRVAIDERSGRVMGDPEPVTTPSSWSGSLSFSRDGTKLAYASLDWRSTLFRASFDPDRGVLAGTPAPVFKNTRPIRDHELSPDGQWVAYVETGAQDDLLVARIDASEYRRLTDDPFRDRGPAWSPDQKRIVFYSDRSGVYQLWTVRPEGSAPEQLVDVPGANFSTWSPDGNRIAFSGVTAGGWFIVDSASKAARPAAPEPSADAATRFWPFSWSRDGSRVAGIVVRPDGASGSTAVYSLASRTFAVVPDTAGHVWQVPVWLPDSRRLIVRDEHGVWLVTPETGARRLLIPVRGYVLGRSVGTSRDGRWITYTETATEGDIWLATLGKS